MMFNLLFCRQDVPSNFRSMADLAHCEAQRVSAEYLGSGREHRFCINNNILI